jgi:hypothetical protein
MLCNSREGAVDKGRCRDKGNTFNDTEQYQYHTSKNTTPNQSVHGSFTEEIRNQGYKSAEKIRQTNGDSGDIESPTGWSSKIQFEAHHEGDPFLGVLFQAFQKGLAGLEDTLDRGKKGSGNGCRRLRRENNEGNRIEENKKRIMRYVGEDSLRDE